MDELFELLEKFTYTVGLVVFLGWVIFSLVVGYVGSTRKIGFLKAFLLSIMFSPYIGVIITFNSKSIDDEAYKQKLLKYQLETRKNVLEIVKNNSQSSTLDDLAKLEKIKNDETISEAEYKNLKTKIINRKDPFLRNLTVK